MSEDPKLMKALGATARDAEEKEAAHLDERWDRLAAGTLGEEERAALYAQAESDPEVARALEAFEPIEAPERRRMALRLRAKIEAESGSKDPRRSFFWWLGFSGAGLAAAAAALLIVLLLPGGQALPDYSVELRGGIQVTRGDTDPERVPGFGPGSTLSIDLRPASEVTGDIEVVVHAVRGDERHRLELAAQIDPRGAVRLRGVVGRELTLLAGFWTLEITVGRPGGEGEGIRFERRIQIVAGEVSP